MPIRNPFINQVNSVISGGKDLWTLALTGRNPFINQVNLVLPGGSHLLLRVWQCRNPFINQVNLVLSIEVLHSGLLVVS